MYYVNLYQTTKCYGGPEEGGWYYEEGVYHSCMGAYSNEKEAKKKADRLKAHKLDFVAKVQECPGENYPQPNALENYRLTGLGIPHWLTDPPCYDYK
tara:strand:- start:208 stop:498 length:291 start_codon:yes stop_codon:yes gene_type:complete